MPTYTEEDFNQQDNWKIYDAVIGGGGSGGATEAKQIDQIALESDPEGSVFVVDATGESVFKSYQTGFGGNRGSVFVEPAAVTSVFMDLNNSGGSATEKSVMKDNAGKSVFCDQGGTAQGQSVFTNNNGYGLVKVQFHELSSEHFSAPNIGGIINDFNAYFTAHPEYRFLDSGIQVTNVGTYTGYLVFTLA